MKKNKNEIKTNTDLLLQADHLRYKKIKLQADKEFKKTLLLILFLEKSYNIFMLALCIFVLLFTLYMGFVQ